MVKLSKTFSRSLQKKK